MIQSSLISPEDKTSIVKRIEEPEKRYNISNMKLLSKKTRNEKEGIQNRIDKTFENNITISLNISNIELKLKKIFSTKNMTNTASSEIITPTERQQSVTKPQVILNAQIKSTITRVKTTQPGIYRYSPFASIKSTRIFLSTPKIPIVRQRIKPIYKKKKVQSIFGKL